MGATADNYITVSCDEGIDYDPSLRRFGRSPLLRIHPETRGRAGGRIQAVAPRTRLKVGLIGPAIL